MRIAATSDQIVQKTFHHQNPDAAFFQSFQSAFQDAVNNHHATEDALGETHQMLEAARDLSVESGNQYAAILNRAYSSGAMNDPQRFLQSLSSDELHVVQEQHGLADAIQPQQVSAEGAYNLLLPTGYSMDFNKDGIDEVGIARTMHFPPNDAPPEFLKAWNDTTATMSGGDIMSYGLLIHGNLYGLSVDDSVTPTSLRPADSNNSYEQIISNFLAYLESFKNSIPEEQYKKDKAFFTTLQTHLQQNLTA